MRSGPRAPSACGSLVICSKRAAMVTSPRSDGSASTGRLSVISSLSALEAGDALPEQIEGERPGKCLGDAGPAGGCGVHERHHPGEQVLFLYLEDLPFRGDLPGGCAVWSPAGRARGAGIWRGAGSARRRWRSRGPRTGVPGRTGP